MSGSKLIEGTIIEYGNDIFCTTVMLATGMGLFLGILNVFVRDLGQQVVPIFLQIWFCLTPIVYLLSIISLQYRHYFAFNPVSLVTYNYHQVIMYNNSARVITLSFITLISFVILLASLFLFRRTSSEMVDVM